jgi:uncharacterized membrane protein
MGFSSFEAIIIVFVCYLFGSGLVDHYVGFPFSNIPLFSYNLWQVGINFGGAIIPILLSIYLIMKNKLPLLRIGLGILIVAIITYVVTYPDPEKGIVSAFPYWLLPIFSASIISAILLWKTKRTIAPVAYISGTVGVLVGADLLHLYALLSISLETTRRAVIGGANVFDMIFLTGIFAVILDGFFFHRIQKKEKQ